MFAMSLDQLVWVFVALAFGGLTKGLTGLGLPLVTVPVLAGVFGVERAVLIMVIPSFLLNVYPAYTHRDAAGQVPELKRLLIGGAPGAAIGATILQLASERFLATTLAIWLLAYLTLRLVHPHFALSADVRRRLSPLVGVSAGALQASTGISAPIVAPYMDAIRLEPRAYVFAVCTSFGTFAGAHLLLVSSTGVYTTELLAQSAAAVLVAIGFVPVGVWARRFISGRAFDWVIRLTLLVMSGRILYGAWV